MVHLLAQQPALCSGGRTAVAPVARAQRGAIRHHRLRLAASGTQNSTQMLDLGSHAEGGVALTPTEQGMAAQASLKHEAAAPFNFSEAWYPVAFVKDLDPKQLHRFTLLKTPLVIWWDATVSGWRAFKDECPHRLVPLSEGRVNQQGELECGYHGWSFRGDGGCTRIPQGGNAASPRACAITYACEERQGLLFVYASPLRPNGALPDPRLIPIVPELEDPAWIPSDTWRDLPMDFSVLLENVLDSSHVPFTHHKSMSNRNVINTYDVKLLEGVSIAGFSGNWGAGPRGGTLGPQSTEFRPPGYMKHKLQSKTLDSLVIVYAVPISPGKCRLINRNVVRVKAGPGPLIGKLLGLVPGWVGHVGSHVLLEDDQIFLHHGELEVATRKARGEKIGQSYFTPSQADTYVLALHRWLDNPKLGGGGPWGPVDEAYLEALGPRLSRDELLDRWTQHTSHCRQCQQGLRQVTAARQALAWLQQGLQAAALLCGATAAMAAALGPAGQAGGLAAAVGAQAAAGTLSGVQSALLAALHVVVGSSLNLGDLLVRMAVFGSAALAVAGLGAKAEGVRQLFYTGVYPPPRNVAKD